MGTIAIIALIAKELARLNEQRASLIRQAKVAGNRRSPAPGETAKKPKRHLTPEGRARISAAQRKYWAAATKERKQKTTLQRSISPVVFQREVRPGAVPQDQHSWQY